MRKTSLPVDTATDPSFPLSNRAARAVWRCFELTLFRLSPVPFHGWRSWLLRLFGAKVEAGAHVYPGASIWAPWNLSVGPQAGVASSAILYCVDKIVIGRRAVISQGAHICTGTHDYEVSGFPLRMKPIVIGDYAWIAAEAFILPGVTIGEGAIIGVRSVVTKDMPPWTVCAGSPCRPLKLRQWRPGHRAGPEEELLSAGVGSASSTSGAMP